MKIVNEAMTKFEALAKQEIMQKLREEGYPTYADILDCFVLNVTAEDNFIACTFPEEKEPRILLNKNLDAKQMSYVIRHEILHLWREHSERLIKKLAKDAGLDYDTLSEESLNDLKKEMYSNSLFNIAADYEISNVGYTDRDKAIGRKMYIYDSVLNATKIVRGLVTEDDHPDWVDLSMEEMYDLLKKEYEDEEQKMKNIILGKSNGVSRGHVVMGSFDPNTGTFTDEEGNVVDADELINSVPDMDDYMSKLPPKGITQNDLERMFKAVDDITSKRKGGHN